LLPVVRVFRKGETHAYRVHLDANDRGYDEQIDYIVGLKCKDPGKESSSAVIFLKFSGYRDVAAGHVARERLVGAGTLTMSGADLPDEIKATIQSPHYWYPLLCMYLPPDLKSATYDVNSNLGSSSRLIGQGTLKDGIYKLPGRLDMGASGGKEVTLQWTVDQAGWLQSGSGTVTGADGTVTFRIEAK
jgi:hypothetical protein